MRLFRRKPPSPRQKETIRNKKEMKQKRDETQEQKRRIQMEKLPVRLTI